MLASLTLMGACSHSRGPAGAVLSCEVDPQSLFIRDIEPYLSPGQRDTVKVGVRGEDGDLEPLPRQCIPQWAVSRGAATISPIRGVLHLLPHAPTPDTVVVQAQVGIEDVQRTFVVGSHIVERPGSRSEMDQYTLVGGWRQMGQTLCRKPGVAETPTEPIRELEFKADRRFHVTWLPFERYVDYWGSYDLDPQSGTIEMRVDGGNYIPEDLVLEGTVRMDEDGRLHLVGISLGSPRGGASSRYCGSTWRQMW